MLQNMCLFIKYMYDMSAKEINIYLHKKKKEG